MAGSVKNRVVPAVPIPSTLYCAEEVPTRDEVGRTKPCVNMLFLPLQSCTVEDMAKAKVLSERTESIPIKNITPVIDEEHHSCKLYFFRISKVWQPSVQKHMLAALLSLS